MLNVLVIVMVKRNKIISMTTKVLHRYENQYGSKIICHKCEKPIKNNYKTFSRSKGNRHSYYHIRCAKRVLLL